MTHNMVLFIRYFDLLRHEYELDKTSWSDSSQKSDSIIEADH